MFSTTLTVLTALALHCAAEIKPGIEPPQEYDVGSDLARYISRPELNHPLFDITHHEPDKITPGYWFMAPYHSLEAPVKAAEYIPYQAGPHIFDNNGDLIWSGAEYATNRNCYDVRLAYVGDTPVISFILDRSRTFKELSPGTGVILNTDYTLRQNVQINQGSEMIDMHEFNIKYGKSCVNVWRTGVNVNLAPYNMTMKMGRLVDTGIREIDLESGEVLFEWRPSQHIGLDEVMIDPPQGFGNVSITKNWDCFHMNSCDKNEYGDYIASLRFTSAIYKISGKDGSVLWRLGGTKSDFVQDFNFSSQHDVKFYSSNSSVTVISFLDNASDEQDRQPATSTTSSIKLVALYENETPPRAKLLRQFDRPDGGLTMLRGRGQFLPNGGVFAGWSEHGYISEFAPDGSLVLEAKYSGHRFHSYRAYKANFVGTPAEPIALKTHAYILDGLSNSMASQFAVSWNGATEVASWSFFGSNDRSKNFQHLGTTARTGFETILISPQFWAYSYAQAIAANGTKLKTSPIVEIILPNSHLGNGTLAGFISTKEQADRQSVIVLSTVVFVGLVLSGIISVSLIFWKRSGSIFRQAYTPMSNTDGATEAGERVAVLNYEDDSDDESEDGKDRLSAEKIQTRAMVNKVDYDAD